MKGQKVYYVPKSHYDDLLYYTKQLRDRIVLKPFTRQINLPWLYKLELRILRKNETK